MNLIIVESPTKARTLSRFLGKDYSVLATLREGRLCRREGITINVFLLPTWSQSAEDVQFAYRLAESTSGRVFFTAGKDLDRYVLWDYLNHRREIVA